MMRLSSFNILFMAVDTSGKMKWIKTANAKNGFAYIQMENLSKFLQANTSLNFILQIQIPSVRVANPLVQTTKIYSVRNS